MRRMQNVFVIGRWLLVRLPLAFSIPLVLLVWAWIMSYGALHGWLHRNHWLQWVYDSLENDGLQALPDVMVQSLISIAVFTLGLLLAYNLAALCNTIVYRLGLKPRQFRRFGEYVSTKRNPSAAQQARGNHSGEEHEKKWKNVHRYFEKRDIGIILAGGGAKGAFQAGAMKAIHEFLDAHDVVDRVKMVAGTSIGAWNALFWMADLVRRDPKQPMSPHEYWWKWMNAKALVAPSGYFPLARNAFLSSRPWQDVYDRIFTTPKMFCENLNFYLTRTNVRLGRREFVTNNKKLPTQLPSIARESYRVLDSNLPDEEYLEKLRDGVFASMDLPPLFPYLRRNHRYFEDGGVIDNLPIYFGTGVEHCDFLFVLPLNASFEVFDVNTTSVAMRLFRVMNVRQGELERRGFKTAYLYNEQAVLRKLLVGEPPEDEEKWEHWIKRAIQALENSPHWNEVDSVERKVAERLLERHLQYTNMFVVVPQQPLVIETTEFWNTRGAVEAFDVMYGATRDLLHDYTFEETQEKITAAMVSRGGEISYLDRF